MEDNMGAGNVLDRSQISTSFLILGCTETTDVSSITIMAVGIEHVAACRKSGGGVPSGRLVQS
jgi:hypothetical protein